MSELGRREVLAALLSLATGAAAGGQAQAAAPPQIDVEGGRRVGRAYVEAHPGFDAERARAALLPDGWTPATSTRLRQRVAADFRAGRLFVHRGWRLSDTEGRLFALLAAAS